MAEDDKSLVELSIGENCVVIEGSEDFISDELSTILDIVDLSKQPKPIQMGSPATLDSGNAGGEIGDAPLAAGQAGLDDINPKLAEVANKINVDPEDLSKEFYIDEHGVHIQNPMDIEQKYALLGYCTIKEESTGDPYHDNSETKSALIDEEKVNIGDWGGKLLYSLRQDGCIKDDPNTSKTRNKPFKVTPSGREDLVNWLNEDD